MALVALSFQIWRRSTETDKQEFVWPIERVAAVCGIMIVSIAFFVSYALVAVALAGTAIGIAWTTLGNGVR
jgi:hypothetical protein